MQARARVLVAALELAAAALVGQTVSDAAVQSPMRACAGGSAEPLDLPPWQKQSLTNRCPWRTRRLSHATARSDIYLK